MNWETEKLKDYIVYGIIDPETDLYVYIGSTKNRLWDRKNGHVSQLFNWDLRAWVKLKKEKLQNPIYVVVHECDKQAQDLLYWEYFYIKKFRSEGHPLFNITMRNIAYPNPSTKIIIYE